MASAVVFGAWLATFAMVLVFVASYGSRIPYMDEFDIIRYFGRFNELGLGWLWSAHNEHRIPITRLLYLGLVEPRRDLRLVMFLDVALLAFAALGSILAVRRWRGRTRLTDVLFVPLFLGLGHHENLLTAFQVSLVLPATISVLILAILVASPKPRRKVAIGVGGLAMLLPLSGAPGFLLALPIATWALVEGAIGRRSADAERRRAAPIWFAVSGGTLLLCVLYLTAGSPLPVSMTARVSAGRSVLDALDLLALRTGWTGSTGPVLMRWAVVPIGVLTLGQVLPWLRERASDSWRRVGIVACGLGTVILACSIGWSRGADFQHGVPPRYTTLFAPFFASLYMIWTMSATGWTRSVLQWSLLLGILSAIPAETSSALEYARSRKRASDDLIADADAGLDPMELARRHWRFFFTREDEFAEGLVRLRHLGFPPFRTPEIGPAEDPRSVQPFFLWSVSPVETISDQPILRRRVFGMSVVQVHAPAELVFQVPPGAHHAHGRFGIPPVAYSNPKRATTALRFTVEREDEAMRRTVDFLEQLDPGRSPADRGIRAFSIDLPSTGSERLILRVEPTTSGSDEWAWACWADLQFDADG